MEPTKCIWPDCSYENCACDKKTTKVKIEDMNERQLLDALRNVKTEVPYVDPDFDPCRGYSYAKKKVVIEPNPLVEKALNDAFVAGKSKQTFRSFRKEWLKTNL